MDQPGSAPDWADLTLEQLRAYRRALEAEESKVSYWWGVIKARADVTQAGASLVATDDDHALSSVLCRDPACTGRTPMLRLCRDDDAPPFPDIAPLWVRLDPPDEVSRTALVADLRQVEARLLAYQHDLEDRIDAAMAETILRYQSDPSLCLSALPQEQQCAG